MLSGSLFLGCLHITVQLLPATTDVLSLWSSSNAQISPPPPPPQKKKKAQELQFRASVKTLFIQSPISNSLIAQILKNFRIQKSVVTLLPGNYNHYVRYPMRLYEILSSKT